MCICEQNIVCGQDIRQCLNIATPQKINKLHSCIFGNECQPHEKINQIFSDKNEFFARMNCNQIMLKQVNTVLILNNRYNSGNVQNEFKKN